MPGSNIPLASAQNSTRGRLKVFFGYAAGVGKTYAMLEAAHQRQTEGWDVLVGAVEDTLPAETARLLAGLEALPMRTLLQHGVTFRELDLEGLIQRRPRLALIDDLAHRNAPGALHPHRYQDVQDLLDAGMDVYTTINAHNLASLSDVVAQITGLPVHETIPDAILDAADEIELVDLPPDELLTRLADGKIAVSEQAARTLRKFFRKGNLTALRELTLRRAAERVDDQMRTYMRARSIAGPWPAAERLLVCLSLNPQAERLIRTTRRLADELNAEWLAVYVNTPANLRQPLEEREQLQAVLSLAEQLGAQTLRVNGKDPAEAIQQTAKAHNVTKIVIGRPPGPRWREALRGSVADELIARSGAIDVLVLGDAAAPEKETRTVLAGLRARQSGWQRYAAGLLLVGLAALLSAALRLYFSPTNLVMFFILAVLVAAVYLGRGPALLASFSGVFVFDYFFVPPYYTFNVADTEYLLTFTVMLAVDLVISQLATRAREQTAAAEQREAETAMLYALSRSLAVVEGLENILDSVTQAAAHMFSAQIWLYLTDESGADLLTYGSPAGEPGAETEQTAARWVLVHGQAAGRGTGTLPGSPARYLPLKTLHAVVGVLCIAPLPGSAADLTETQLRILEAYASQAALAIERAQLEKQARRAQLLQATQQLQSALLNSISHELRTPLVSITGVLNFLDDEAALEEEPARRQMIHTARRDSERLNRLVANLLDMSRLEAGALHVLKEPNDLQDAIGVALNQMEERLEGRPLSVQVNPQLSLVPMDFVLIVHVLVNLLENAHKYSPPGAPLEIRAGPAVGGVLVEVLDRGAGLEPGEEERIFEKFYRGRAGTQTGGTGLGLSICRGIIEAHGGRIWARPRPGGGAAVSFTLPISPEGEALES